MDILKKFGSKAKVADPNKPLSNTKNWYADRYQTILVQRNILAAITFVALLATLISSYSVAQLTPLKSVQPFVIQVDEKSGVTQVLDNSKDKKLMTNEAVKQYFIVKYIQARESYNDLIYKDNFNTTRVLSDSMIFAAYQKILSPDNAQSPVVKYARHSQRVVEFLSLTFVNDNAAQVRIRTHAEGRLAAEGVEKPVIYVIWITFEFANMDLTLKERYINPLGFRVTSYTIEEELGNK